MKSSVHYHQISVADFMKNFVPQTQEQLSDELDFSIDLRKFKPNSKTGKRDEKGCYSILCNYIDRALGSNGDDDEGDEDTNDGHFVCRNVSDWPDLSLVSEAKSRGEAPAWSESLNESHHGDPGPEISSLDSETHPPTDSDLFPPRRSSGTERIDLAVFRVRSESGEKCRLPWAHSVKVKDDRHGECATRNPYAYTMMGLEVKVKGDAWGKTASEFLPDTGIGSDFRGQVCEYVAEILARQHRTFFFTVSVYQTTARLMRWDRLGVIVSEPIDLEAEPKEFYEFFFRLRKATNVQLGFDPTATLIEIDEYTDSHPSIVAVTEAITSLPRAASRIKPYISKAFTDGSWPYYELQVPDRANPDKMHRFLVRNPSSHSRAPTGRATKGYIAFDLETRKFCFLKDSWRPDSFNVHPELEVYERFRGVDPPIPCLATVCCGGDLFSIIDGETVKQTTRTQEWIDDLHYHARLHTRIVLNEVGVPLKDYTDSLELCHAVSDAILAHAAAWEATEVLHRDISDGNIIIYFDFTEPSQVTEGLLIDWDLSKYRNELGRVSQQNRSGTWRFLSAALLNYPFKPYELADDLESFYHLLCLFALRYHNHGKTSFSLRDILTTVYYASERRQGHWVGSEAKYDRVASGQVPCKLQGVFGKVLSDMAQVIKDHYAGLSVTLQQHALPEEPSSSPVSNQSRPRKRPIYGSNASIVPRFMDLSAVNTAHGPNPEPEGGPTRSRPLDKHATLFAVLNNALKDYPEEKWDPDDKLPDQFAKINWSPKRTLDFTESSTAGGSQSKRPRATPSDTVRGAAISGASSGTRSKGSEGLVDPS
ncbi:hypothetical protein BXZ70DRAFT_1008623 [Cristinia sonorae]|uniref:Fungal-type protein kinase domain-containing protein n=1 Tax=Cristinia sonorae TaxID=1940300 RepID=A0A8K0UMT0_9AGAR|nr:hypothetical protein BXZ70DRAFT_1008623 [Cristinia sonorae]